MKATLVTGLWDLGRDKLTEGWARSFDSHYLPRLKELLDADISMIIFGDERVEKFVHENRKENFIFIRRELSWFKNNFFDSIQEIRNNPGWYNQAEWLKESTQARLEYYNPIVMSKMFLLHDAKLLDPFDSSHLIWVDAGLTNTIHYGYFTHDKVFDKIGKYFNKFSFIAYPYDGQVEIHGFEYKAMCKYARGSVDKVCRGGIFGGPKETIAEANSIYYSLLQDTLHHKYMGTEESIFTIILYRYPTLFQYFPINGDGLIWPFFEGLKNDNLQSKIQSGKSKKENPHDINKVGLYVLSFNSPKQFETLCQSFELYDNDFLEKPKKYLVNNSTDKSTDAEYDGLCEKYGFETIHKGSNVGICGGRQIVADHADKHVDYSMFFEDDMFFYVGDDEFCKNGFRRKIKNFYVAVMNIIWNENLDFLKLNFTEFFGNNQKQWAWFNVPQDVREELFPEYPVREGSSTAEGPYLKYENIKCYNITENDGLPYATGEVYYCNWPQVVSKEGNRKMFLETKWEYPYEQTWMSFIYQKTAKGQLSSGVLLATPTEHNRFEFYPKEQRKENNG